LRTTIDLFAITEIIDVLLRLFVSNPKVNYLSNAG